MSTVTHASAPTESDAGRTAYRPDVRRVVGALWLFATLNYIYCDVLGTHDPDYLRAILTGTLNGVEMTQGFLLGASVLVSIPMVAVLITRIAPHRVARWTSIVGGIVMTVVQIATLFIGTTTSYYAYFSVIEIATTLAITWIAVRRWSTEA